MEQAVNLFNKGLLMDTHPMVLGNDTLSDALNATFVTMNGNEVVLQNDMGNRRVDSAYLPSGYEPVGIKEYGGVIYVAAYNPLTNRGQIGSFPSPLRKINILNLNSRLEFNNFLIYLDGEYNINVNSITIPISINENGENIVLHTGDKFSIYSSEIVDLLPFICQDTSGQYLKNNLFTFLIGLFNSLNEFIDISDKLKLWEINNYKYYINNSQVDDSYNGEGDLIKARNSLAINTYSYKMASPLYLRAVINHVDNVSYSIIGDKKENGECKIYIDVTYTYNCVDTINNEFFKIEFNGRPCTLIELNINPIYLPELEKYQLKLSYEIDNVEFEESAFKYTIKFPLLYNTNFNSNFGENFNFPIYLKSLELSGTLNSTLFGSDTVIPDKYRYYYDLSNNTTTLDVSILSYPMKNSQYTVYPIIYSNTESWELPQLEGNPPGTGSYTIIFNHSQILSNLGNNLEEREQYKIKFVKKLGLLEEDIDVPNAWDGMYVTTPIFNGNYIGKEHLEGILANGEYNYDVIKNAYIKNFYNIKYFLLSPKIGYTYTLRSSKTFTNVEGNIIYLKTGNETEGIYNLLDSYTVETTITPIINISNLELYPKEIDNLLTVSNITINNNNNIYRTLNNTIVNKIDNSYKYSSGLSVYSGNYSDLNPKDVITITEEYLLNSGNYELNFKSTVLINNYIKGTLVVKDNIPYNYKITSFWDYIRRYFNGNYSNFLGISSPYICVDIIGSNPSLLVKKGRFEDISWLGDDPDRQLFGLQNFYPLEQINAALLSASENLLLLDVNTENYMAMCYPSCYGGEYSLNDPFKRIWLKISEKEYTPIYSTYYKSSDLSINNPFMDSEGWFKLVCLHIPHYFAYSLDSGSFGAKIISYSNNSKTKEFNIDSKVTINLIASILRGLSNNFKLQGENGLISTINLELSFSEPNIVSNEKILEDYDNLKNFRVNCILEHPVKAYHLDEGIRVIEYKDSEGNDFDPLYVYYSKPISDLYKIDVEEIYDEGFVKSYRASKFKTEKGDNFPELKPSNELYHASDGRFHPYINPIVFPSLNEISEIISYHESTSDFTEINSKPHYAAYHKDTVEGGRTYLKKPEGIHFYNNHDYSNDIRLFLDHNNSIHAEHTMLLANLDGSDDFWCIYLDTKNIFDYIEINNRKLYNSNLSTWIDADTALQN